MEYFFFLLYDVRQYTLIPQSGLLKKIASP